MVWIMPPAGKPLNAISNAWTSLGSIFLSPPPLKRKEAPSGSHFLPFHCSRQSSSPAACFSPELIPGRRRQPLLINNLPDHLARSRPATVPRPPLFFLTGQKSGLMRAASSPTTRTSATRFGRLLFPGRVIL